ncbi:hypothetical protein AAX26_00152 [Aliarcobacter thereius]|uniref:Uncharacterized protein n=1 Tax=Aliarcobacter thereius LMG 24486 TaxID=1032240 RepID=A0A1C7WMH9_9BACT|nr:hypothetical protein [Aliarcobacter thereius]OCL88471.1 hypothetical protein AAX26_00152 [Aliarcobacter thereius]OCL91961.1 hypothetical protein AAX25_00686 [Aliarcobacter thereius]OCL94941.1 hypothetical protein AA347_00387 [Aliarcobacter thereius LMG 24486]QBF15187.1 hypothetical protein ATH_0090 [Aliarcobacter thereius LMG 24486]TLS93001.1 hypothetical protein FE244_05695 [Aliarcobacter thereius]
MNFTNSISKHIAKLVGTLLEEDELQKALKRKFTKREFKVFVAFEEGKSIEEIKLLLKENDSEEIEKVYKTAIKKLNQEIFKKELIERD